MSAPCLSFLARRSGCSAATPPLACAVALLTALAAPAALGAGTVRVSYVEPDRYADAGRGAHERQRTMTALTDYLQDLGKQLPDGRTLNVEVTEIDLAGNLDPARLGSELRVVRGGADWPRLHLRYTLLDGDRVQRSGQARLADLNYLDGLRPASQASTELAYEKRMLKQWFEQTILP